MKNEARRTPRVTGVTSPEEFEVGELMVEDRYGVHTIKFPARNARQRHFHGGRHSSTAKDLRGLLDAGFEEHLSKTCRAGKADLHYFGNRFEKLRKGRLILPSDSLPTQWR